MENNMENNEDYEEVEENISTDSSSSDNEEKEEKSEKIKDKAKRDKKHKVVVVDDEIEKYNENVDKKRVKDKYKYESRNGFSRFGLWLVNHLFLGIPEWIAPHVFAADGKGHGQTKSERLKKIDEISCTKRKYLIAAGNIETGFWGKLFYSFFDKLTFGLTSLFTILVCKLFSGTKKKRKDLADREVYRFSNISDIKRESKFDEKMEQSKNVFRQSFEGAEVGDGYLVVISSNMDKTGGYSSGRTSVASNFKNDSNTSENKLTLEFH